MEEHVLYKEDILKEALYKCNLYAAGDNFVRIFLDVATGKVDAEIYSDSLSDLVDATGYILLTEFRQIPITWEKPEDNVSHNREEKENWLNVRRYEIETVLNELT